MHFPAVTAERDSQAAMQADHLRSPGSLSPRILPWCGLLLWLGSVTVVVIFGQFLLPHALTEEPIFQRTSGGVVAGAVVLGVLVCLHWAYWRRVIGHVRAELRLRHEVTESFGMRLALLRDLPASRPPVAMAGLWPTQLMAFGVTVIFMCMIALTAATNALFSPGGSVDSPLLAFIFSDCACSRSLWR